MNLLKQEERWRKQEFDLKHHGIGASVTHPFFVLNQRSQEKKIFENGRKDTTSVNNRAGAN